MGRLIDADLLYKAMQDAEELARKRVRDTESTLPYPTNLNPAYTRYLAQMDERTKAKKMVADAPTVDAVPVVHGRWETVEDWDGDEHYKCSVCGAEFILIDGDPDENDYLYCPHCGARDVLHTTATHPIQFCYNCAACLLDEEPAGAMTAAEIISEEYGDMIDRDEEESD